MDTAARTVVDRDGVATYEPAYLERAEADAVFDALLATTAWRQDAITLFGRTVPLPRLTAWYGDPGAAYAYSGIRNEPLPWTAPLAALRDRLCATHGFRYNSVLLNLYRDGRAGMGWHADDEPELDADAPIASLSLGATRTFRLRHSGGRARDDIVSDGGSRGDGSPDAASAATVRLEHGSLLVMRPPLQRHWRHAVPRQPAVTAPRINLTFRAIVIPQEA